MEDFKLAKFTREGENLLNEVRAEFNQMQIDDSGLPKFLSSEDSAIKLVFIGQYSAGKSSLIKMLTGEDVKIGAKITTQNTGSYMWNGIEIIDTPGIHSGLRPDLTPRF